MVEEGGLEQLLAVAPADLGEIGEVVRLEAQRLDQVDRVLQPASEREPSSERIAAEGHVERRLQLLHAGLPVRVGHGELVQIGEQGERRPVQLGRKAHGHTLSLQAWAATGGRCRARCSASLAAPQSARKASCTKPLIR